MKVSTLDDYDALYELLDGINEAGEEPQVAGVDSAGRTFLAMLAGPYAEAASAVLGNPWSPEIGWGGECDECGGGRHAIWTAERLDYPVTVLGPAGGATDEQPEQEQGWPPLTAATTNSPTGRVRSSR